ncbi:MAG TPA: hypothetical protein VH639_27880 [Bryobacteraceae bacterium]
MRFVFTVLLAAWVTLAGAECVAECLNGLEARSGTPPCHRHSSNPADKSNSCLHPKLVGLAGESFASIAASPEPASIALSACSASAPRRFGPPTMMETDPVPLVLRI